MADFQAHLDEFTQNGVSVYAVSTDDGEHVRETAEKNGVTFPMLYGIDGPGVSAAWGSYYEERRNILHATGFILTPDRTVFSATYSTGPIGRITAPDTLGLIKFVKSRS